MMIFIKPSILVILLIVLLHRSEGSSSGSQNTNDDSVSIPMIASGKRMHNIMRFGKRPADGDSYTEHEKRDGTKPPQHSFLYFGKRDDERGTLPDAILRYLQDGTRNASVKKNNNNQHNMMRFGKRSPDDQVYDYDGYPPEDGDEDKRGGHNMMYFGKRGGHNMMYFGKRTAGHNILSFGKRPAGHNMLSFGKRAAGHNMLSFGKRAAGHSILSFGKRDGDEMSQGWPEELKRAAGHSILSFGKRPSGHAMLSFGKRDGEDMSQGWPEELKRAGGHSMFHFGKRDDYDDDNDEDDDYSPEKRASHSMIHFGKRDHDEIDPLPFFLNPAASEQLYQYGKKTGKNNHAMIHFGKRSVDAATEGDASPTDNATSDHPSTRTKRDLEAVEGPEQMLPLAPYRGIDEDDADDDLESVIKQPAAVYYPGGIVNPYVVDPLLSISPDYRPFDKKQASKNMFMRFG